MGKAQSQIEREVKVDDLFDRNKKRLGNKERPRSIHIPSLSIPSSSSYFTKKFSPRSISPRSERRKENQPNELQDISMDDIEFYENIGWGATGKLIIFFKKVIYQFNLWNG